MKVFISWSGEKSKLVAEALREWIPKVIQAAKPWLSKSDIDAGARWNIDIAKELEDTKFGIICLSSDNLTAPWIMFEAGALSKSLDETHVCPYLIDIEPSDLTGPLVQFQAKKANKQDTKKLIQTMNKAMGNNLENDILEEIFEKGGQI